MEQITKIWKLFDKGVSEHRRMALESDTERAYRFYEGDQWYGLENGEPLPVYNFIAPTVKYKVASTAMNQMQIYFSPMHSGARTARLVQALNTAAASWWEKLGMDTVCWQALKDSAIAGESYLYIYNEQGDCQLIDNTDVFLGDETTADIRRQPYIILRERRDAAELRQKMLSVGLPPEEADKIVSDNAHQKPLTTENGHHDDGKCTVLMYMRREGNDLIFERCTRHVSFGEKRIKGLNCYPLVGLVTGQKKGSARGRGEVRPLIANQIEINRNLVRRLLNAKMTAFSRLVYATDKIDDPEALGEVGSAIAVNDSTIADIHSAVGYLSPAPMSADAKIISDEMLSLSRELAGAGEVVTGNIDPSTASGTAIIAVRDQAEIPLNENMALFRRFVEDVAAVWYKLWICYGTGVLADKENDFTVSELMALRPRIRVDATSTTPYSKYAREETLDKLLQRGDITFEEYVESLDDDCSVPKARLMEILKRRKENLNGIIAEL